MVLFLECRPRVVYQRCGCYSTSGAFESSIENASGQRWAMTFSLSIWFCCTCTFHMRVLNRAQHVWIMDNVAYFGILAYFL